MNTFELLQIIAGTPWWVYVLFIYLMGIAYYATKPQYVPINNLLIVTGIFVVFSIIGIVSHLQLTLPNSLTYLVMLVLGAGLGWLNFIYLKVKGVKGRPGKKQVYIRGTWLLFFVVIFAFAAKYYFGYQFALNPDMFKDAKIALLFSGLYGFFTGFFLGRTAYALHVVKRGPFITAPSAN